MANFVPSIALSCCARAIVITRAIVPVGASAHLVVLQGKSPGDLGRAAADLGICGGELGGFAGGKAFPPVSSERDMVSPARTLVISPNVVATTEKVSLMSGMRSFRSGNGVATMPAGPKRLELAVAIPAGGPAAEQRDR